MKTLKLVAISYVIKTLLVGVAWFFIPDLPQRTTALVRRWVGLESPAAASPAPAAAPVPVSTKP